MRFGLGLCDCVIDGPCLFLDRFGQRQASDEIGNVAGRRVVMMVYMPVIVVMRMRVRMFLPMRVVMSVYVSLAVVMAGRIRLMLLRAVHGHTHVRARNAAGGGRAGLQADAGQAQTVHGRDKTILVLQQFIQGGHEHIARRTHVAFNIQCSHLDVSSSPSIWLIRLAK